MAVRVHRHGTQCNDMKLRTIIFVAPWCRFMFNKKGVPMGFGRMLKSFRSVCASTFSGLVLDVFGTERQ